MTGSFRNGKYEGCQPCALGLEELHSVVRHDNTVDDKLMAKAEIQRRLRATWQWRQQYEARATRPRRRA